MIVVLVILVILVAVAAARFAALPRPAVRSAARDVRAAVRGGSPYAYQYVLKGAGGPDAGDHDADKLVVRADRVGPLVVVRVAPVDRAGKRTGRARLLIG